MVQLLRNQAHKMTVNFLYIDLMSTFVCYVQEWGDSNAKQCSYLSSSLSVTY